MTVVGTIGPGATLTSGIQDVAALLPLLGTEQCEYHVSSALTKGYLYVAATPLSIFGSLGIARAGFKTLVASFAIAKWNLVGARKLANMGFEPKGTNLSLIMMDENNHYLVENRLDNLLKELHIDDTKQVKVVTKCLKWNITMMLITAITCILSVIPYVYLNIHGKNHLNRTARWIFPSIRALGGFLTATMMQLIIQSRIMTLTNNWLASRRRTDVASGLDVGESQMFSPDPKKDLGSGTLGNKSYPETGSATVPMNLEILQPSDIEKGLEAIENATPSTPVTGNKTMLNGERCSADGNSALTWCFLTLLLIGIIASIIGYVGCFTVVQNAQSASGPLTWLCLEACLSVVRIVIWSLNPTYDHAPPLEFIQALNDDMSLPTCEKYDDEIKEEKTLPLTRSDQFLEAITSSVGLVKRFNHPALTLYYTLTRKRDLIGPVWFLGDRVLYITVFDYKERTTRVFTCDSKMNYIHSTGSDVPIIDLKNHHIKVKLGDVIDVANDPIINNSFLQSISNHHQSIVNSISSATTHPNRKRTYSVFNSWTMKMANTETGSVKGGDETHHRLDGQNIIRGISSDPSAFPELDRLLERWQSLVETRGKWIIAYMDIAREEMASIDLEMQRPVDDQSQTEEVSSTLKEKTKEVDEQCMGERLLVEEQFNMEILLVYEVAMWEVQLWEWMCGMPGNDDSKMQMKATLNCRTRLGAELRVANGRLNASSQHHDARTDDEISQRWRDIHAQVSHGWKMVLEQSEDMSDFLHLPNCFDRLAHELGKAADPVQKRINEGLLDAAQRERCRRRWNGMERRLKREAEDIEWRLTRGLELCDQFWNDRQLVKCRHSQSKWLWLHRGRLESSLDAYSNELKKGNSPICVEFSWFATNDINWIVDTIRGMPSVTSIGCAGRTLTLPSIEDNHHLLSVSGDFILTPEIQGVLNRNRSSLEQTRMTFIFIEGKFVVDDLELSLGPESRITISFVGLTSSTLILRLIHRSSQLNTTLTIQGSSTFELPIPTSHITHDITLPSDRLLIEPGIRNQLMLTVNRGGNYYLRDIQLLGNNGRQYKPRFESDS